MNNEDGDATERISPDDKNTPSELADEAALDAFVSNADIALVEFYTSGCGICESMEPVVSNIARELDIAAGTVNPRNDPPLIDRFDVRSVPLFVLFVDGAVTARRADGFISGDDLTEWITENTR